MASEDARAVLDEALFGNVFNMRYDEDNYQITFEGNNYVVWDIEENELYHFVVEIREEVWDSAEAVADQEWELDAD